MIILVLLYEFLAIENWIERVDVVQEDRHEGIQMRLFR